jgi:glycyl-tRNA synthetase beta chain
VLLFAKALENALGEYVEFVAPYVPNNTFFDGVMVMADDAELKANRLRLLAQLRGLFTSVADISVLQH